jgi:two-component sensor histidine kinase
MATISALENWIEEAECRTWVLVRIFATTLELGSVSATRFVMKPGLQPLIFGCDLGWKMNRPISSISENGLLSERLLLREFSHRINNELAFAIGSLSVAAARCDSSEARAALAAAKDRLQSFAHVHRSLQMPDYSTMIDVTVYLRKLCQAISHSKLESNGIELSLSLYPFRMSSERCWYLGMIVFELITNAAQHAFNRGSGEILLELLPSGASVECRITDNGTSDGDVNPGLGFEIVEALAVNLQGTIDMQFGPQGARSVLIFPLDSRSV